MMVVTEAVLISYVCYVAHFIMLQLGYTHPVEFDSLAVNIALVTLVILLSSLSVGLYESKLRETFRGIIRRIFVSVGLSYFVAEIVLEAFFGSIKIDGYFLPVSLCLIIVVLVIFRYFSIRLGLLGLGRANLINKR